MSVREPELPTHLWKSEMDVFSPDLSRAFTSWLSAIESIPAPALLTAKLIRLALSVVAPSPAGVRRNTILAAELGATWDDIFGTMVLTVPSGGLGPLAWAVEIAKQAYDEVVSSHGPAMPE